MAAIFENRRIESDDFKFLKFRGDNSENLPPNWNKLKSGQISKLDVKDDQGSTHTLTVKNSSGRLRFTDGWEQFTKEKEIKKDDEISLYKKDGDNSGAQCIIKVKKANQKRDR